MKISKLLPRTGLCTRTNAEMQLAQQLSDADFRATFGEKHTAWIGPQIRVVREQRGLSQAELARRTNTRQSAISRMENVDYGRWSVHKLQQLCRVLGCWVEVRLRPYGGLLESVNHKGRLQLQVPSYEEDWLLHGSIPPLPDALDERVRMVQIEIQQWFLTQRNPSAKAFARQMRRWLDGWDLPGVAEDEDPSPLLASAFTSGSWGQRRLGILDQALVELLRDLAKNAGDAPLASAGVFQLCAELPNTELFEDELAAVLTQVEGGSLRLTAHQGRTFARALAANQSGIRFLHVWKGVIAGEPAAFDLDLILALNGIDMIPSTLPDVHMASFVAWVAVELFERYITEIKKEGMDRLTVRTNYLEMLKQFFSRQKSFQQRPALVAILAFELIARRRRWNQFFMNAFASAFWIEAQQAREILIEAADVYYLVDGGSDYRSTVINELGRLAEEKDYEFGANRNPTEINWRDKALNSLVLERKELLEANPNPTWISA